MANQCIIDNNKVFLGDDRIDDFERELFVSRFLSDKSTQFISATTGQFNAEETLLQRLKLDPFCGSRITKQDPPVPVIMMPEVGEKISLAAWLQDPKNQNPIPKEVVSTFAFQLIWLVGKLQSQYGIIHNNISEKTILVQEIITPKPMRFSCENDAFEVQLGVGHLEVFISNFDFAVLKKLGQYESKASPWEMLPANLPQTNNCPEAFFAENYKKMSECDLFSIGHVLLTMHLHGNYQNFVYDVIHGGIHVHTIREDYNNTMPLLSVLSRDVYNLIPSDDEILYSSFDVKTPEAVEMFLLNLVALDVAIQGNAVVTNIPINMSGISKRWYDDIKNTTSLVNYVQTRFSGLLGQCGDKHSQSLIQRLMDFNPVVRRGVSDYALLGYLFHPYFAGFYRGYTTSLSPTSSDEVLDFFAPPLEYSNTFIEGASWGFIQQRIADFETLFKKDLESQKQGWEKIVEDTKAKKKVEDEAREKRRLEVEERKRLKKEAEEKKRLEEEEAKKKKQLEEEEEETEEVPMVSLDHCLVFIRFLQDRKWTFEANPLLVSKDEVSGGYAIIANTNDCIQMIISLAKRDEKKLQILEAAKITQRDTTGKYVARKVVLKDKKDANTNDFVYLQDQEYDGYVFNLPQMARNGAYLSAGIYAMTNNLTRDQVLAFVRDIDAVDEASATSTVHMIQEKTAELQGNVYVFKLPGQEILKAPGIVNKDVESDVLQSLADKLKLLVEPLLKTTSGYKTNPDIFLAVSKDIVQEFANTLNAISLIYQNSPKSIQEFLKNTPNWKHISANDRFIESFKYSRDEKAEANGAINYIIATTAVQDDPFLKEHTYSFYSRNNHIISDYSSKGGILGKMIIVVNSVMRVLRRISTNSDDIPSSTQTAFKAFSTKQTPDNLIGYLIVVLEEVSQLEKIKK